MFWKRRTTEDDPNILRLRPSPGYGDHLMVSAVIEGLKAEHAHLRVFLAAKHPELFLHNPRVESVLQSDRLRKRNPAEYERYRRIRPRHPTRRYLQVSGPLIDDLYDATGVPCATKLREPKLYLSERELGYAKRRIEALPRPRIAIAPYGKGVVRLPNKIYPQDQWTELAGLLVKFAGSVLQLGTRTEGPRVPGAVDLRDIGYRRSASVLRRCDLLVTHVGGIMHLAAAVRTPAVVLYGAAEHPAISGYPWNRNLYEPIECGPCWMEEPCSHHTCMRRLTPERVMDEVRGALSAERWRGERRQI